MRLQIKLNNEKFEFEIEGAADRSPLEFPIIEFDIEPIDEEEVVVTEARIGAYNGPPMRAFYKSVREACLTYPWDGRYYDDVPRIDE